MSKNSRKKLSFIVPKTLCTALVISGLFWSHTALAVKKSEAVKKDPEVKAVSPEEYSEKVKELVQFLKGETDPFVYTREGRSDPFRPFVSEKEVQKEKEEEKEELTGMRRFEPGQLVLTAIVFAESGPIAMVQDAVGIGYVLREGNELGRSGVVDKISKNLVVIKQKYKNTAGEEKSRLVEMLLKKEGEQ